MDEQEYFKGRGAQIKAGNKFLKAQYVAEHIEGLDEPMFSSPHTQVYYEQAKKVVNKVTSPDLSLMYSINPYQGCEHGCIYCYARNSHEYWGFNAGLDFESKIIVKKNAPELVEKFIMHPDWSALPLSVSGNTDCYQPLERKLEITRGILKVMGKYRHPVGMITKNALVTRDVDILTDLAKDNLVHVYVSITTLDENLRRAMEPRTASGIKRLQTLEQLAKAGIPTGVMCAPIIPGLNQHEIPNILKAAADHGALTAGMTIVRLNGTIGEIFEDWLRKNFPDRFDKVWHQIGEMHGGRVNDSQFGRRITGEGTYAEVVHKMFRTARRRFFGERTMPAYDLTRFRKNGNLTLF